MKVSGRLTLDDQKDRENYSSSTIPRADGGNCKYFRKTRIDSVTGKSFTLIAEGKEKAGTLSCIIALKSTTDNMKFGKVLYFSDHGEGEEAFESACIGIFSVSAQDKPSGLWWVDTNTSIEEIVPVDHISKPLVTAKDDSISNKLWILNFRL